MKITMTRQSPTDYAVGFVRGHRDRARCISSPCFAVIRVEDDHGFHLTDSLFHVPGVPHDAFFETLPEAKKAATKLIREYVKSADQRSKNNVG